MLANRLYLAIALLLSFVAFGFAQAIVVVKDEIKDAVKDAAKDTVKEKAAKGKAPDAKEKAKELVPAEPALTGEEFALKEAYIKADAATLLDFFRKRTPPFVEAGQVAEQIKLLADKQLPVGEKAMGQLIAMGQAAVGQLRQTANNLDTAESATAHGNV